METEFADSIQAAGLRLLLKEPFFGHVFAGILKKKSEIASSIALSAGPGGMPELLISKEYWINVIGYSQTTSEHNDYQVGMIKHQILHLIFRHPLLIKDYKDKRLFGIAADIFVNQFIHHSDLPSGSISRELFPDAQLDDCRNIKKVYSELENYRLGARRAEAQLSVGEKLILQLLDSQNKQLDQHIFWNDFRKMHSALRFNFSEYIQKLIRSGMSRSGNKIAAGFPVALWDYLKQEDSESDSGLPWKRILRLYTEKGKRTRLKNTLTRPSKRYGSHPGHKVKKYRKVLVAIDTSGSVSAVELNIFFTEVHRIWRSGSEVYLLESDEKIRKKYAYSGTAPNKVHGKGNTNYDEVLAYANNVYNPDCLIYFTDGFGPKPEILPKKEMLWVITKKGIPEGHENWIALPGRMIRIN